MDSIHFSTPDTGISVAGQGRERSPRMHMPFEYVKHVAHQLEPNSPWKMPDVTMDKLWSNHMPRAVQGLTSLHPCMANWHIPPGNWTRQE